MDSAQRHSRFASVGLALLLLLCQACGTAVTFDSSLESGNGADFTEVGEDEYSFVLEPDTNSNDRQWFQFDVGGAQGQTLTFHLLDTDQTNVPRHWDIALPVASYDEGRSWHPVTGPASREGTTFSFTHSVDGDPERIAFHFPYTHSRLLERMDGWARHRHCERSVIGHSVEGRPIEMLTITNPESLPEHGKRGIWITARQHGAEVTGSWMCEGLIDFLLSTEEQARALRDGAAISIVPMVNPDGAVAGNYRVNAAGVNLNRVWEDPSEEESPEVLAVVEAIARWTDAGNPYDLFIDLHSTSGGNSNFAFHPAPSIEPPLHADPPGYHTDIREILDLVASHCPDFDPEGGSSSSMNEALSRQRQMQVYGVLALLFEGTYNFTDYGPNQGELMTPERHREIGRALGLAMGEFFGLVPGGS